MTLAFFGLLQIGELTCDSHFNPDRQLTISDLVFMPKSSPKYMLVRLKVSKTDPFRKGQTTVIGRANSKLCPISATVAYLIWSPVPPFPTQGPYLLFNLVPSLLGADLLVRPGFYFQRVGLICWSQFSHRRNHHSCFSQLAPLAHYGFGAMVLRLF